MTFTISAWQIVSAIGGTALAVMLAALGLRFWFITLGNGDWS